jgi:hypothetical protein
MAAAAARLAANSQVKSMAIPPTLYTSIQSKHAEMLKCDRICRCSKVLSQNI